MEMPTAPASSQRKRPHFSYSDDSDADEAPRIKKARFPKGKKDGAQGEFSGRGLGVVDGEEDDGPILLSTDPRVAALERSTRRDRVAEQMLAEDRSVPSDVALAEEEYDGEDEERVEDGVRIEPFNLKQEREEGYFDAEGNYVEYRNDNDTKDAWLESVEGNAQFAAGKTLAESMEDPESEKDLSKAEIAGIKRRIADALQPEETVLRALRRLKGMAKEGERMSGEIKVLFDQLTEDAMKLLDSGDYNVYEERRETFQREAEGYEALARLRSGMPNGAGPSAGYGESSTNGLQGDSSDMFSSAQDDILEQAGPSSNGSGFVPGSHLGVAKENGNDLDIFGGSDEGDTAVDIFSDNAGNSLESGGEAHISAQPIVAQGVVPEEGSGYVFDESSGYYFNSELGYYYDANSGLYCSASSGQWYRFDGERNSYEEVTQ